MEINLIDERNLHEVAVAPTFRVVDWSAPDVNGVGTVATTYEVTSANLWEVLAWAEQDRPGRPVFSEIYVTIDTEGDNEYLVGSLIGTLAWDRSNSTTRVTCGLVSNYRTAE